MFNIGNILLNVYYEVLVGQVAGHYDRDRVDGLHGIDVERQLVQGQRQHDVRGEPRPRYEASQRRLQRPLL